jgi:hypothetical protein
MEPWTGDALNRMEVPESPGTPNVFSSECWSALANDDGNGLTVFVPTCYPYVHAIAFPQDGPGAGGDYYYFRQFSSFTVEPGGVIEGEAYLIPGPVDEARKLVVALHETLPPVEIDTSLGLVETPAPNADLQGRDVVFGGWAIDATVTSIEVDLDGNSIGTTSLTVDRPDIVEKYPNAPLQCGWTLTFDSTTVKNGDHTVSVVITDAAGNVARMAPVAVTVSN